MHNKTHLIEVSFIYSNLLLKANLHFLAYFPHFFQEEYCL